MSTLPDDRPTWGAFLWAATRWVLRLIFRPLHRRVWVYLALPLLVLSQATEPGFGRIALGALAVATFPAWLVLRTHNPHVAKWWQRREDAWAGRKLARATVEVLEDLHIDGATAAATPTAVGYSLAVTIPRGVTREALEHTAPALREALSVHRLTADAREDIPGCVRFRAVTRDILRDPLNGFPDFLAYSVQRSARAWVPVGVDQDGNPVELPLYLAEAGGVRYLAAGASGSGKNSTITLLATGAVLAGPSCFRLWFADPKATELAPFRPWAERYADTAPGIVEMLEALVLEMRSRQKLLARRGGQRWDDTTDGPIIVLFLDELTAITSGLGDRQLRMRAETALEDLAARSRSAGITLYLNTQSPTVDVIPSSVRSNLDIRLGFRVLTLIMAEVIQPGSTTDGYGSADRIPGEYDRDGRLSCAGVFYLDGLGPRQLARAYYLPSEAIPEVLADVPHVNPAPNPAPSGDDEPFDWSVVRPPIAGLLPPAPPRAERRPRRRRRRPSDIMGGGE